MLCYSTFHITNNEVVNIAKVLKEGHFFFRHHSQTYLELVATFLKQLSVTLTFDI